MAKSARGGDRDSDSRVPPWTCHSEIPNNRRDLQFLGSSGLPIPIPSVTSCAQISCECARFDALTNSFAITSFRKKIIERWGSCVGLTISKIHCGDRACSMFRHRNRWRTSSTCCDTGDGKGGDAGRCAKDLSDYKSAAQSLCPASAVSCEDRSPLLLVRHGKAVDTTRLRRNMERVAALHA